MVTGLTAGAWGDRRGRGLDQLSRLSKARRSGEGYEEMMVVVYDVYCVSLREERR